MENGFYFYQNQLKQAEVYNSELIRVIGEIDKKLRKTKRVYFEILEPKSKFLICMDDCVMIAKLVEMSGTAIFILEIPKSFNWREDSPINSLSEIYSQQTKSNVIADKRNVRVILNAIVQQSKKLLECGVKSTVFN